MIDDASDSFRLLQSLSPDRTFLCADVSDNVVVLKRLDEDCLYRTQLHPNIKDRLAKVRELPHSKIATLRSVERWYGQVYVVWVFLDGETWSDATAKPTVDLPTLKNSLRSAVSALHDLGIIHGNLHGNNIIVRPDGQVWLTDLSPYLYTDPAEDIAAMKHLLGPVQPQKKMSAAIAVPEVNDIYRATSLVAAAGCIVFALIFGVLCRSKLQKPTSRLPTTFPSLKH